MRILRNPTPKYLLGEESFGVQFYLYEIFPYKMTETIKIKRSKRKSIALSVNNQGLIVVKAPIKVSDNKIREFVVKNKKWIEKQQKKSSSNINKLNNLSFDSRNKREIINKMRTYFNNETQFYANILEVSYKKVKISGAKKRWGSCNSRGFINLNWKLYFAPDEIKKYVVIHEICHLKHHNHSKGFWEEVRKLCPNFKIYKKWLTDNNFILMVE